MFDSLRPGDVVLADALFDNYFLICELRKQEIDIVTRVKYERSNSEMIESSSTATSWSGTAPAWRVA